MKKSLVLLAAFLLVLPAAALADADEEVAYKAEFIISLVDNIEWPEDGEAGDNDEFVIYVVGECPVQGKLQELADDASEDGKNIAVKVVSFTDDLSESDILFKPSDDLSMLAKELKKVKGSKTVTVADAEHFARYGVMISFFESEKDSEIHYEVNKLVVESAGISLSAKVLDKAEQI